VVRARYRPSSGVLLLVGGLLVGLGLLASPRLLGSGGAVEVWGPLSLGIGMAGGLLVLVALATVALASGQRDAAGRLGYGSHATIIGLTLLAGVGSLAVVLPALLPAPGSRNPSVLGFLLSAVVLDVTLVALVYFRVVRPGLITWRDMGLSRGALPLTWRAGLTAAPMLFLLAAALELVLKGLGIRQTQLESLEWLHTVPLWQYALVAFSAAILAPIAEEIYFRGYVFRAYLEQKGPVQAYLFSSLLFALVHLNLPAMLPIFVVGLFLAFLYHRTGSVLPGMVAHGFNNAVAFTVLYFAT
jgi:membrane protease YdiL (CAAX protease family)